MNALAFVLLSIAVWLIALLTVFVLGFADVAQVALASPLAVSALVLVFGYVAARRSGGRP